MTIGAYGAASFSAQRSTELFRGIKADLSAVQTQLSTGKQATSYLGLGSGVAPSLTLRAKLGSLNTYAANIADGTLRLNLMSASVQGIGKVSDTLRSSLSNATGESLAGATQSSVVARTGLDAAIDALNVDVNGRHLFGGRATDSEPVASAGLILNGDASRAGLTTLIAQRKAADGGPDGMGRLALSVSGATVSLAEEAAGLPFGLKLGDISTTAPGSITATLGGSPNAAGIVLTAQPAEGDTITVKLTLPDGTGQDVTLEAGAATAGDGSTSFEIGATAADTAANLSAALSTAIKNAVATTLPSASALKSATDFFEADVGHPPARVAGPPYDTATTTVAGTTSNTVIWYAGDTSPSPRDTAPLRIGDDRTVGIGAQANEPAFRQVLAGFAALAADTFPPTDTTSAGRYAALATRISASLSSGTGAASLAGMTADLSVANAAVKSASGSLAVARSQAQDALSGIEDADPNEAAVKLMATQTRLQASYQITATLQKMSLVNYL